MLIFRSWSWILFFYGILEKSREATQEAPISDKNQVNEDRPNEDLRNKPEILSPLETEG